MNELFPTATGLVAGLLLASLRPSMRLPVGVILSVMLGTLATVVSGE